MATHDEIAELVRELHAPRECRHCGTWFNEAENLGFHRCRRHPDLLQSVQEDYGGRLDTYTCCGVSPHGWHDAYEVDRALGCVACDHTSDPGRPDDIVVPIERAQIIFQESLRGRDLVVDRVQSTVTILRERAIAR